MPSERASNILARVSPPQVRLTYDFEIGGAIERRELPFVVGVLADLTGQPAEPLPPIRSRKFVEVNPDNFDFVMGGLKPHLALAVENKLTDEEDGSRLKIELLFKSLEDFEPQSLARQVSPLGQLLELRTKLADLGGTLATNDRLQRGRSTGFRATRISIK